MPRPLRIVVLLCLVLPLPWLAPGLLLGRLLVRGRAEEGDGLATLPLALAAPALILPWLRLTRLPWQAFWFLAAAVSLVCLAVMLWRDREDRGRWLLAPAGWLPLAAGIYWAPHLGLAAPSGIDMGMHLGFARLLLDGSAIPTTQDPFLPGVSFGLYPLGFHALVALTARAWHDLATAGIALAALTQAFFAVAVYLVLRRGPGVDRVALAASVLTVWLARNPQHYVSWGGNPCVLGSAFGLVALRRLHDALRRPDRRTWLEAALLVAAAALTHPTAAVVTALGATLVLLVFLARRPSLSRDHLRTLWPGALTLVAVLAPLVPDLLHPGLSRGEQAWITANLQVPPQAPEPGLGGAFSHVVGAYGDTALVAVALLGLLVIGRDRGRSLALASLTVIVLELLAWLASRQLVPLATTLIPERVMLFALPALAWPVREWLGAAWTTLRTGARCSRRLATGVVLLALVATAGAKHQWYYHHALHGGQYVTTADREALAWLAAHAEPGSLVETEYFDAGQYVPALAGLPHTAPQLNPVWMYEARAVLAGWPPRYAFVGARTYNDRSRERSQPPEGEVVFTARDAQGTAQVIRLP
jgi:hypothetical protein